MNSLRNISSLLILSLLFGCGPIAGTVPPAKGTSGPYITFPRTWTPTATKTATAGTGIAASPNESETPIINSTETPYPTQTKTSRPTGIPTPTRGLPPSLTSAPREECPPPTYAKVEIHYETLTEDYGSQILEYFRAYGDRTGLEEQLERLGQTVEKTVDGKTGEKQLVFFPNRVDFSEADVTGDGVKETLIILLTYSGEGVGQPYDYYEAEVFIVGCRNRQYTLYSLNIYQAPHYQMLEYSHNILDLQDLNADGIPEILLITSGMQQGSNPTEFFPSFEMEIYEWDGKDFPGYHIYIPYVITTVPEVRDMDGNGTKEILLPLFRERKDCKRGPEIDWKMVLMWNGKEYAEMWDDPGEPEYRFQAAFFADYYVQIALYDRAEKLYRRAVLDPSLKKFSLHEWGREPGYSCDDYEDTDPGEAQRIIAYARFRLLELNAFLEDLAAAESGAVYLSENYREGMNGYPYAVLGIAFWEAYQVDHRIEDACAAVRREAAQQSDVVFDPLYYGKANPGPTMDTICPFSSGS
jgi:hypothetical protein